MRTKGQLIAFVHMERCAGTTFIHILRHNFFLRHLDVRPFRSSSRGIFSADDLQISRRIVPPLSCIAGHSIKPYSNLITAAPNIRYITILRNPIKRYLSHYQYWIKKKGKSLSFEQFLDLEETKNLQTKKIAGKDDINIAISSLERKIYLVGFVEEFDQFLLLLKKKLSAKQFDPRYRRQNISYKQMNIQDLGHCFKEKIRRNNMHDIELYNFAKNCLYPKYIAEYGDHFSDDINEFRTNNAQVKVPKIRLYSDFLLRKIYLEPATGLIRKAQGLPAKGSY